MSLSFSLLCFTHIIDDLCINNICINLCLLGQRPSCQEMCSNWLSNIPVVTCAVVFICFLIYLITAFQDPSVITNNAICADKVHHIIFIYFFIVSFLKTKHKMYVRMDVYIIMITY